MTTNLSQAFLSTEEKTALADHLAGAIRVQTVSYLEADRIDPQSFLDLHAYLAHNYPKVHARLKLELVNQYSLLFTWEGRRTDLKPVLFTGHIDVVPVEAGSEVNWGQPPFSGNVTDGFIWGRGTLDCKNTVIGVLEAVEMLLSAGFQPERTIMLAFGHDEEIGGKQGAAAISGLLKARSVFLEAVIDEGLAIIEGFSSLIPKPCALIGIAEKGYTTLALTVEGGGGHSSSPPRDTAIGILAQAVGRLEKNPMPARMGAVMSQMFDRILPALTGSMKFVIRYRKLFQPILLKKISASPAMNAMIRTTFAPTIFHAGVKDNILPTSASAAVNIRILPGDSIESVIQFVKKVIDDPRVDIQPMPGFALQPSPVSSTDSPSFLKLKESIHEIFPDVLIAPGLVLGATDCRYYQPLTQNAYRFSPMWVHPEDLNRVHGTNERINLTNFCDSVIFYKKLIQNWSEA